MKILVRVDVLKSCWNVGGWIANQCAGCGENWWDYKLLDVCERLEAVLTLAIN